MPVKERKITVKHYLNKRAKAKLLGGEKYYPLYLQLIVSGHKAQLKSKISDYFNVYRGNLEKLFPDAEKLKLINQGYFTDALFRKINSENIFPLSSLFANETELISDIIRTILHYNTKNFSLFNFSSLYDEHIKDIHEILELAVQKYYIRELNDIFLRSTKSEDSRKLFKVSNYFIHFINWENSFCDYYEITYEVLPSEIKFLENHLTDELKTDIKALLAFHSRSNYLRRFLDKSEKGLLPNVNYMDWLDSGREFISREFINIFGKQKAQEYMNSLDRILSKELRPAVIL
ncbi:MAG: hypothetical protein H6538_03780 [Bacteroidales bacterium]|nr:hypothetical protein [Bacteroidales bacterium]MCB9000295.1 hypothetical protein [Bacteroidales bacterium]